LIAPERRAVAPQVDGGLIEKREAAFGIGGLDRNR
jgi:hypothetical protein